MTPRDDFLKIAEFDVRVDFRRRKPPMSEQFLDLANVGFALQKMRRARMAQCVRRDVLLYSGIFCRFCDDPHDVGGIEPSARTR